MTTAIRQSLIDGLVRDMYDFSFADNMGMQHDPIYRKIFKMERMEGSATTKSTGLLNVNFEKTNNGESVKYTDPTSGRKLPAKMERYTAAMRVDRNLVENDAQKPALKGIISEWQRNALRVLLEQKEQYYADLLNKAGYTSGDSIYNQTSGLFNDPSGDFAYDGKPLINLSGNVRTIKGAPKDGTTNSFFNGLGATGADLTTDNFASARTKLVRTNAFNDAGNRIVQVPTHLVVPSDLYSEAFQIVKTTIGLPGEVNNGANPWNNSVEIVENPYLSSASAWFLMSDQGSWISYEDDPIFDAWFCDETKSYKVSIDVQYGHGIYSVLNVVGGNNPTS